MELNLVVLMEAVFLSMTDAMVHLTVVTNLMKNTAIWSSSIKMFTTRNHPQLQRMKPEPTLQSAFVSLAFLPLMKSA
jgi:hypothetical protein